MDPSMEFAERVKELMQLHRESVKSLSEATGITQSSIYGYLGGRHLPSLAGALRISDHFLCPLDFLFGFTEDYRETPRPVVADVTARLRQLIDASGMSRYRIAKESGFDQTQLLRWYHGKLTPALANLLTLAAVLGCSLDELAGR